MIQVIKDGIIPEEPTMTLTCDNCGCIFKATKEEFVVKNSRFCNKTKILQVSPNEDYCIEWYDWVQFSINCPCCSKIIRKNYIDNDSFKLAEKGFGNV